jgi:Rap1a immunity proteins
MKYALLSLLLLPLSITAAVAQTQGADDMSKSGNAYLHACEKQIHSGQASTQSLLCETWMHGVLNGFVAYFIESHTKLFEIPTGTTTEQCEKIAVKYMNDHPKDLNKPTAALVLRAFMDAYPPQGH